MQRKRRTSWGLRDVRNNRRKDDQTGNFCRNRSRLTTLRDSLTCPGAERRMCRLVLVVGMLIGTRGCGQRRRAGSHQTHQSEIHYRCDSGECLSEVPMATIRDHASPYAYLYTPFQVRLSTDRCHSLQQKRSSNRHRPIRQTRHHGHDERSQPLEMIERVVAERPA